MSNDIKNIVTGLIELYDTNNPFELCECLDISLIFSDLGNELLGFFQKTNKDYEILHINTKLNYYMQKYICAHELGHAILQPELSVSFFIKSPFIIKNKYEIEADLFAAELLVDDCCISAYKDLTLEQIAAIKHVPKQLIELKINTLSTYNM